jgi:hypothetical protein
MVAVLRNILAVIVGVVVGGSINMLLVVSGPMVIPPPPGVDVTDGRSLSANMHLLEARHFVFPFLAHALGTLAGAVAAFLVAGSHRIAFAYAIGIVFLAGGIAAAFMIPAPAWFIALDLLLAYIPMAWIGTMIGRRLRGTAPSNEPSAA